MGAGCAGAETDLDLLLTNNLVEVAFNYAGLASIRDLDLDKRFHFASDAFSITINEVEIQSEQLRPDAITPDGNRLTYSYHAEGYKIDVVYELQPGWRFISKQLFVTAFAEEQYHVNDVEVFRSRLREAIVGDFIARTRRPDLETKAYGAFFRFADATGMFVLVQNPFLEIERKSNAFAIYYDADIDWKGEYGAFSSDRGCIGTYALTGQKLPVVMLPEWELPSESGSLGSGDGQDAAEVEAFTACVQAFLLYQPSRTLKMHVDWNENVYQIDVATEEGRTEYKRIIAAAADLGLEYVLYAPFNTNLANRAESADDWNWEIKLWLGLGQNIRKGEWNPKSDPIPPTVQEMLDYAQSKGIKLVPAVYPSLPFSQNPEWLVYGSIYHVKKQNASLGVRSFQDWLIENLVAFYKRTGIGGYAFDYTFLWYEGTSRYAQWWGWRRVMETLRKELPEMVIDGRQLYHEYGPWTLLAGSYPHPTAADEQPESFNPFPDIHFDRVSAHRQRYTAYRYRNYEYLPAEIMPGFMTHQTPRIDDSGNMPLSPFRLRNWDYLGWKYSVISSIASAGFNHVVSMIPARDLEEYEHLSDEDKQWMKGWLSWTDENIAYLRNTKFIIGQPAIGRVDGTSAIVEDQGYIFLFNPNGRQLQAEFVLDESIGLNVKGRYLLEEIYPMKEKLPGSTKGFWDYSDQMSITMDGTSALVLEINPLAAQITAQPLLFNAPGRIELRGEEVILSKVQGEIGASVELLVLLPDLQRVRRVSVNGLQLPFTRKGRLISVPVRFAGAYFSRSQQIGGYERQFAGGTFSGSFSIPGRIFKQLKERKEAWPISWNKEDLRTTWLAPERLFIFVQVAEPRQEMDVKLYLDGESTALEKAYTSIRAHERSFVGWYLDVSSLEPEQQYQVQLELPTLKPGQFQGLFFDNVETEYTAEIIN